MGRNKSRYSFRRLRDQQTKQNNTLYWLGFYCFRLFAVCILIFRLEKVSTYYTAFCTVKLNTGLAALSTKSKMTSMMAILGISRHCKPFNSWKFLLYKIVPTVTLKIETENITISLAILQRIIRMTLYCYEKVVLLQIIFLIKIRLITIWEVRTKLQNI